MSTQQDVEAASSTKARVVRRPNPMIVAAAGVAVVGLGAGGWFGLLSPQDSVVKLGADTSSATPGKPVPLFGTVTPAEASRVVQISIATAQGGPFAPAGTAVTDATGHFTMTWSPTQPGPAWVRASAVTLGRNQQALSAPVALTVRTPAVLTLKAATAAIRTTGNTTVTANLTPAGGAVTFEKSTDGQSWTPLDVPASTKPGAATAKVAGLPGGLWHFRATAAQTDTATTATAKEVTVLVEDYKAAGAKYLQIVGPGNKSIDKFNSLINSGASLAALKKQAEVLSKEMTKEVKAFGAYKGWPREVAPVIADLAKQDVLDADNLHMRSQSRTFAEWNQLADEGEAANNAGSADAARIRDILGLPKRNLHP
jgi:hypothetical protein